MPAQTNAQLVDELVAAGDLVRPELSAAFRAVDRVHFVPSALAGEAYADYPLPIGQGQTISQPSTVAFMLEQLQPEVGQRVLEVGAGSGYVAALLAKVVGQTGHVFALEVLPELVDVARQHLARYHFSQLELIEADGSRGYPEQAPYGRIIVSAAAPELPRELKDQLTIGGRLVAPIGGYSQDIVLIERTLEGFTERRFPGFVFVPLVPGKE